MLDKILHQLFWRGIGLLVVLLVWPLWLYIWLTELAERHQRGS